MATEQHILGIQQTLTQMRDQIQDFARRISHNTDSVAQITNRIDASEQQILGGQSQTVQLRADVDYLKNWNGTLETNVLGMLSRLAALESRGGGGSGTRPKMALTEMRGAAIIPEYRGDSDGWEEFSLRFRVFLGQNCPTTRDLLKWAETVDDSNMTEAFVRQWGGEQLDRDQRPRLVARTAQRTPGGQVPRGGPQSVEVLREPRDDQRAAGVEAHSRDCQGPREGPHRSPEHRSV